MGIIGEMRGVPQSWDEYLYGLVASPLEAIGEWGTEHQTPVTGGWQVPFQVIADAAPFMARGLGEWGGQLREASEGMPLTSDAGGFPPDSPLAFLNQRVNERGAAVIDAATGIIGPGAVRTGRAVREVAEAIPDIAMEAYGPRRSASWLIGGERAGTADRGLLAAAKEMEKDVPGSIDAWQNTGWFNDPSDYRWKFEIPDTNARAKVRQALDSQVQKKTEQWAQYDDAAYLRGYVARGEAADTAAARDLFMEVFKREPQPGAFQLADNNDFEYLKRKSSDLEHDLQYKNQVWRGRLADVLDHPEAYKAYPELADVPVTMLPRDRLGGAGGWWSDTTGITLPNDFQFDDEALRTLLHEVQHGIQGIEDFSAGGSWDGLEGLLANDLRTWSADHRAAREAGDDERARQLFKLWQDAEAGKTVAEDNPMRAYYGLAGEGEARMVEDRLKLAPEDLRLIHPLDSKYDMAAQEHLGTGGQWIPRPTLGMSTPLPKYKGGILGESGPDAGARMSLGDGILRKHVTLTEQDGGILGKTLAETPHNYPAKMGKWPLLSDQGDLNVPTSYRADKFEGLTPASQSFIKQFKTDDFRNKTAVHYNEKTGLSLDFSTSCTKRSGGGCNAGACAYCYVEHDRSAKKAGMGTPTSPKKLVENDYEDEILRMPADLVTNLNRDGGLRMFSFGDFRPGVDDDNVARALADAQKRGLYIKAITKEPELIQRFGDHPNFRANLSIDYLPREASNSFTIEDAIALKNGRDNIKLRGVALNMEEAERMAADPRIDVITLYHGPTGDRLYKIVAEQNPKLIEKFGGEQALRAELARWQNMSPRNGDVKAFMERNAGRVCCQGGKCSTDPHTKCGFASKAVGALLPGVAVPAWFDEEGTPEYF